MGRGNSASLLHEYIFLSTNSYKMAYKMENYINLIMIKVSHFCPQKVQFQYAQH